ncbi:response regulator [Pseudochryseolinea flava]|uniref:Response regulator n=1 Tax=Pseudochryseolinea flava TaxID=2059302 RepID=A0A364XXQ7_9BACT|nr:response regulator [Pseudochryseolinea flava]RAV99030.1 response regulator [Pseudochryseolinea flava]
MVVLYVDDDADDLQLFNEAVKEVDPAIIFIAASSAEEALNFLHGELLPDQIFMDINMPVMNGIECLTRIRSTERIKHVPVVMLSTSQNVSDIEQSNALQADFISKPNSFRNLVAELTTRLKQLK